MKPFRYHLHPTRSEITMFHTLEVIATSVDDAVAAEEGGADRLELVSDLARGGMTPALDVVDRVLAAVKLPVRVMLRESEAHEVADPAIRRRLVERARELGSRPIGGVVCGFLRAGTIDVLLTAAVSDACEGRPVTFHRAIEQCENPLDALTALQVVPSVDRVLASGGDGPWSERAERLTLWASRLAPHVRLIVGGGVTQELLPSIARLAALTDVHVGRAARRDHSVDGPVEASKVAVLRHALDQARQ
jgi:copper homeostasis protein